MIQVTYDAIMTLERCYNPTKIGMPVDYSDTLTNFCKEYRSKVKDLQDIITGLPCDCSTKKHAINTFVLWCVQQVVHLMEDHQCSKDAIIALEQYNDGKIARDELITAADAAAAAAIAASAAAAFADAFADAAAAAAWAADAFAADAADDAYAAAYAAAIASQKTTREQATNAQIDELIQILEVSDETFRITSSGNPL